MLRTHRKLLCLLLAALLLLQLVPAAAAAGPAPTAFYVSPTGSDANDGRSASAPFATLQRAQQAVRSCNAGMQADLTVYLMDGTWELDEPLVFDERDSGTNGFTVRYAAAPGARPILSGGKRLTSAWTPATEVNWLSGGLRAYKTPLTRNAKLRAIYVNDQRAAMTRKVLTPKRTIGTYSITAGQADWAWVSGSKPAGSVIDSSLLPATTRNPQNIELESGSTWVKALVCAAALSDLGNGETRVDFQMPYAAMAQNLGWNCAYNPTGRNDVTNVYEWLANEGEFYFDQAGSTLYYIPRAGEDLASAEVVVPELDQLIIVRGSDPMHQYAENITFDGIKFAYTDWNLYEVAGSYGNATHQAATILTKYANDDWHKDIYRAYDVPTAAITVNTAKNIRFLNTEISNTGYLGLHLENDVWNCDVVGNYIAQTGGAGIVVGHPQHVYENDTAQHRVGNGVTYEKEKFPAGTESVPRHISIENNYLLENCYFFPGNSPITSFFTYDMRVCNNFVYKCSYSGLSIGWAWCEFDGDRESKLPGLPTTTSRKNTVNNNRIEEICSLLQDAGGIYTLGQQGNEDWTDVTVMNNNYINCKRAPQQADGSRMVNGFHPDEGSAYITMDGNVVTNIIRNVYELNDWKRKHDVIVTNGFSNTDRSETTAPNCTVEQYVNADYIWPITGYNTVLRSGLTDEYVHLIGKDVIADTEYELASNVRMEAGMRLPRRGLLAADDTVWLAPNGTTSFSEGPTMTKAAGNEKSILLPEQVGTYKLYIVYADGTVSDASEHTVYLGEAKDVANVADGARYSVSARRPLTLALNTDAYAFTLDGAPVRDGHRITAIGNFTLVATPLGSADEPQTFHFSTYSSEANVLLPANVTVRSGGTVELGATLNDPSLRLWIASASASAFAESDAMTSAPGTAASLTAPKETGSYDLAVVNADGDILSRSDAVIKVVATEPMADIDFTTAASADRFEIVGQSASAIREGQGLYMITTKDAFEPANDQLSGSSATNPKDLVRIPVSGDWTATLEFDFDPASASNGYYQFFGFYAMQDYSNCAGIRGGDGAMQDFLRSGGTVTAETQNSGPGLSAKGTYWYRIEKEGTSYTCSRSSDGVTFTQMFAFPSTGIEASAIAIDAYTGMTEGYTFLLRSLSFGAPPAAATCRHSFAPAVTAPACLAGGLTTYTCALCGLSFTGNATAALGHNWDGGKITRPATATQEGEKTFTCTRCGETRTEAIPPIPDGPKECPSKTFTDVPAEGDWVHAGIDYCVKNGLMNGTSATLFSPKGSVTRAQLVTILYRVAGTPTVTEPSKFTDVPANQWYTDPIAWAAANGIVTGMNETTFAPMNKITREQIATILYRYTKDATAEGSLDSFPDATKVSPWAKDPLTWAVAQNLITGVKNADNTTTLNPTANATRAQIASIIMRYLEAK